MPPCKGHKKSRNGCTVCKRRRIKCDETHPQCLNCARHGTGSSCLYLNADSEPTSPSLHPSSLSTPASSTIRLDPQSTSLAVAFPTTTSSTVPSIPSKSTAPSTRPIGKCSLCKHIHPNPYILRDRSSIVLSPDFPGAVPGCSIVLLIPLSDTLLGSSKKLSPSLTLTDLSLLHYFILHTSLTISPLPEAQRLWSHYAPGPEMGGKKGFEYVTHAILAAGATHLAWKKSRISMGAKEYGMGKARKTRGTRVVDNGKETKVNEVEEAWALATYHCNHSMQLMKNEIMKGISDDNCHALFLAACACNVYLSCPQPQAIDMQDDLESRKTSNTRGYTALTLTSNKATNVLEHKNRPPKTGLSTTHLLFVRFTFGGILHESWKWICDGPVSLLLRPPHPSGFRFGAKLECKRSDKVVKKLNALAADWEFDPFGRQRNEQTEEEVENVDEEEDLGNVQTATAYYVAAWNLRNIWGVLETCVRDTEATVEGESDVEGNDDHRQETKKGRRRKIRRPDTIRSFIAQFILRTPSRFWDCLDARKPRALIIYAYFCVFWETLNQEEEEDECCWWTRTRAEVDLRAIEEEFKGLEKKFKKTSQQPAPWKDWIEGAWDVLRGLKEGWWFNADEGEDLNTNNRKLVLSEIKETANPSTSTSTANPMNTDGLASGLSIHHHAPFLSSLETLSSVRTTNLPELPTQITLPSVSHVIDIDSTYISGSYLDSAFSGYGEGNCDRSESFGHGTIGSDRGTLELFSPSSLNKPTSSDSSPATYAQQHEYEIMQDFDIGLNRMDFDMATPGQFRSMLDDNIDFDINLLTPDANGRHGVSFTW